LVVALWKSGDLKLCWQISLPKHALTTTIYLYYLLYVFISCLYVMFYQSSTLSLLWVYMCNFTICVISVCTSRAHNWNKIYLIWFDIYFRQLKKWKCDSKNSTSWDSRKPDYKIGICWFSAKHIALRGKSKDWLARELLFQWTSTTKIQFSVLV
jgi:hypothetical protein